MKKDFRFLKSLALTGMLTTSILGTVVYADTENKDVKTEPIGIFNKLVTDTSNVVPFILTNREDYISKKDIEESNEFQNKTIVFDREVQEDTILHTGDTFKVDGTTYTILIYGDVNQDGYIDVFDALTIQENVFDSNLNNVQKVAANVIVADGSDMDVFDALAIQQYSGEFREIIPDKIPEEEQTPTPPTPPVETSKIEDITSTKATLNPYYRYDSEMLIGTVKSATDNVELEEKYIKYTVKKDGSNITNVSNILRYEEKDGIFNVFFYTTEKGEYEITPVVQGKNGLITKDSDNDVIKFMVLENYEVTDIKIEGEGITESKEENIDYEAEVIEGKTIKPTIILYHNYTDKSGKDVPVAITEYNQEIGNVAVEVKITNVIENNKHITNTTKIYNQDDKPIEKDEDTGSFTGMDKLISYIGIKGESVGTGDTLTIKIGRATKIISVDVLEKLKIKGVTTDGTKNVVNAVTGINISLYRGRPDDAVIVDTYNNSVGTGTIYKIGSTFIDIVDEGTESEKIYTIIPIQLVEVGTDGEIVKIIQEKLKKGNNNDNGDNVTLVEKEQTSLNGKNALDINVPRSYCLTGGLYTPTETSSQSIDAIGISLTKSASVTRLAEGLEIKYDGQSGREGTTINVTVVETKKED